MIKIALSGYATADFVARATGPVVIDGTNPIIIPPGNWPRAGGAPFFAGQVLAAAGCDVALIATVGDDSAGQAFIAKVSESGISTAHIHAVPGARTPTCFLVHQDHGRYACFLDRGGETRSTLTPSQAHAVRHADWVVISAGPVWLAEQILGLLAPHQKLVWAVKADQSSFPPSLARSLLAHASIVFCNRHERDFVMSLDATERPLGQVTFETDGEHGVTIYHAGRVTRLPTIKLMALDATGAGDTFAGGALSVLVNDANAVERAAQTGMAQASLLLRQRLARVRAPV